MFCPKCGTRNEDGSQFCYACGTIFENANQPQAQQPMQQPMQQPVVPPVAPPMDPNGKPVVPGKGLGIAGMILGILSLVLFCVWYLGIPCGITGIILSAIGASKAKAAGVKNGMATAGIICSSIALGLAILFIILVVVGVVAATSSPSYYY